MSSEFRSGRIEARVSSSGRVVLEFMSGGDEEQIIDFTPGELSAFCAWARDHSAHSAGGQVDAT